MKNMYVRAVPSTDLNKNTEWFTYPGIWAIYIFFLLFSWVFAMSVFNFSPGIAWTFVHLSHSVDLACGHICYFFYIFVNCLFLFDPVSCTGVDAKNITYHFFHWRKGTPFGDDQGMYNRLTWWEQIDNGKQLTRNRKFLTVVPVVLYLIASHSTNYQNPMLFFNTVAVFVLVVAKFPNMHKVRLFGINGDH